MESREKPKARRSKPFDPRRYPIVLRVVDGYLEISQPDLSIIQVRGKFDEIRQAEEIGRAVLDVMSQATKKYLDLYQSDESIPVPSHPHGTIHRLGEAVLSIGEVGHKLGVSVDTVRRLCRDGELTPVLTRGKHRRFRLKEILNYLEIHKEDPPAEL